MALAFNPDLQGFVADLRDERHQTTPLRLVDTGDTARSGTAPYDGAAEHGLLDHSSIDHTAIDAFAPTGVGDLVIGPMVVRQDAAFRRRRLSAVLAAAAAVYCCWMLVGGLTGVVGGELMGRLVPAAEAAETTTVIETPVEAPTYTVQSGDTLWSIATELRRAGLVDDGGDLRTVVDQLADLNDGAALRPGQHLQLSGLAG